MKLAHGDAGGKGRDGLAKMSRSCKGQVKIMKVKDKVADQGH